MGYINTNLPSETIKNLIDVTGETAQELLVGRIEKINADNTFYISILSGNNTNKVFNSVKLLSPYKNGESGLVVNPEIGSLVLVAVVNTVYQFIVGFLNYHDNTSDLVNSTKEGELIIKTPFGSYIKLSDDNGIDIHTGNSSSLNIGSDIITKASENSYEIDVATERFSGEKSGIVYSYERCYDKDIESTQTNRELIESIGDLLYPYLDITERKPILEIYKGSEPLEDGRATLSIFESNNPETVYAIKVNGENTIRIGKDGSIEINANTLKITANNIDLTSTDKVNVKNLNFLKEGEIYD